MPNDLVPILQSQQGAKVDEAGEPSSAVGGSGPTGARESVVRRRHAAAQAAARQGREAEGGSEGLQRQWALRDAMRAAGRLERERLKLRR